jgi:hypothetical protein
VFLLCQLFVNKGECRMGGNTRLFERHKTRGVFRHQVFAAIPHRSFPMLAGAVVLPNAVQLQLADLL